MLEAVSPCRIHVGCPVVCNGLLKPLSDSLTFASICNCLAGNLGNENLGWFEQQQQQQCAFIDLSSMKPSPIAAVVLALHACCMGHGTLSLLCGSSVACMQPCQSNNPTETYNSCVC